MQQYGKIDPMDDNVSQISEQDSTFNQDFKNYEGMIPTSAMLSPFENGIAKNERSVFGESGSNASDRTSSRNSSVSKVKMNTTEDLDQDGDSFEFFDKERSNSNIIRRTSVKCGKPKSPQFTVRLDDF